MNHYRSLSHTAWDCKYHLIWIPKYRKKVLFGDLRKYLGDVFRELALQKESKVLEGHLVGDHVHMLVSIPPKYAVSQVVGYIKGKSAIHIARTYAGHRHNFIGQYSYCKNVCWAQVQFYWPEFLGKRIFRINSWSR
jgi:putative transposase